jgi:diguanylate cyclase (GGDEF)-like protein
MAPDSVWQDILRDNAPRVAGREYLASRPIDQPWRAWLHGMGSAVYAPVRDDEKPIAMLCIYAVREQAFGPEDVRFAEAVGHVLSTALQRQKAEERLAHLAQFDALTGLPNRALLHDRLAHSLVQARRRQNHVGVLFVDLDRFKQINDTLGHHQGDALIWQVGKRLLACVRAGDTVGRISGDEFAVVLADMAHPDDAALVAQKALEALARSFDLGGNEAYITASIGIAAFPGDGDDAETLLKNADMAMYRAKELARNSYHFFTAEMNERTLAKAALNTDLRRALERGEFTLHYQPKVDLASGKLRGMEALMRWNHPARGLVSPAEFIPALEDSGLIIPVGEWVVEEACRQVRRWQAAGCMPVPVAVNLSPKQFRRRDLDAVIGDALSRSGVSAEFLELEITESCLMENPEDAVRVMRNLRAAGLRISIDDFGTGYSSLSYLTRLPLSALKIDGSFVRDVDSSAESASIVRAIIDMAQNLHLTVIAEGVETEQQAAFLRRHGCDQAQGYFFGRPVAAEKMVERLARA